MKLDDALLEIIACPLCKKKLVYLDEGSNLKCVADKLTFDIVDNVPNLKLAEDKLLQNKD